MIFWAGRLPLKTAFPNYGVKLMKTMKTKAAVVVAAISALPMAAHAALSDDVKNAINGGFTDAQQAAGLIVGGLAVLFGILLVKRLLR